jgi:hypothetical protein
MDAWSNQEIERAAHILQLTHHGKVQLIAFPEKAIAFGVDEVKNGIEFIDDKFSYFYATALKYCSEQNLMIDWERYHYLCDRLKINKNERSTTDGSGALGGEKRSFYERHRGSQQESEKAYPYTNQPYVDKDSQQMIKELRDQQWKESPLRAKNKELNDDIDRIFEKRVPSYDANPVAFMHKWEEIMTTTNPILRKSLDDTADLGLYMMSKLMKNNSLPQHHVQRLLETYPALKKFYYNVE